MVQSHWHRTKLMAQLGDLLVNYVNASFCSVNAAFFVANGVVLWPERLGQNQSDTPGQRGFSAIGFNH
jgi:hypothetical protein